MIKGLLAEAPRCICGREIGIANGRVLWEYQGLENYPQQVRDNAKRIVEALENQKLCWGCVVETINLFSAFLEAKGDLKALVEIIQQDLPEEGDGQQS